VKKTSYIASERERLNGRNEDRWQGDGGVPKQGSDKQRQGLWARGEQKKNLAQLRGDGELAVMFRGVCFNAILQGKKVRRNSGRQDKGNNRKITLRQSKS